MNFIDSSWFRCVLPYCWNSSLRYWFWSSLPYILDLLLVLWALLDGMSWCRTWVVCSESWSSLIASYCRQTYSCFTHLCMSHSKCIPLPPYLVCCFSSIAKRKLIFVDFICLTSFFFCLQRTTPEARGSVLFMSLPVGSTALRLHILCWCCCLPQLNYAGWARNSFSLWCLRLLLVSECSKRFAMYCWVYWRNETEWCAPMMWRDEEREKILIM